MVDEAQKTLTDSGKWLLLGSLVLTGYVLYQLSPILTPFALAAVLAYLGDPITDRLERMGLSRTLAVVVVFTLLSIAATVFLLILAPMLQRQVVTLIQRAPQIIQWVQDQVGTLGADWFGAELVLPAGDELAAMIREHGQEIGGAISVVASTIGRSGAALLGWVVNLALIPVVTFYLLRDWDVMVSRIQELIPRRIEPTVSKLARESNEVLGAFLRGQISVMAALATVYSVGLWMVGIDFALLIGLIAGLISFVPYLGTIVGVGAGLLAAMFQFGDVFHVSMVLVVFGVGQALEGMVLTPLLVGDRIGLHPVAVIFFVLAGGQLFGFLGVLIALPAAAVLMVLLRHAHDEYRRSRFFDDQDGARAGQSDSGNDAAPASRDEAESQPNQDPTAEPSAS